MTEQMNVPKLRFGEFKEHVAKPKKLGQLVDMRSGNTPSKSNSKFWEGTIPWISASSMKGNVFSESEQNVTQLALENGAKLATKGSLLLLVRGSMLFNKIPVGFAGCDVTYNQDVKAINLKSGDDNSYLFHWFKANEYKLLSMVTGTGIGAGKLDSDELLSLPFHQPKPAEQQKIASFLSKVDEKIALLTEKKAKLIEYKKGVMQNLFDSKFQEQDGKLVFVPPTLRFKADDGRDFPNWEKIGLGKLAKKSSTKNKENNVNIVLTNSATQGIISQNDYFQKDIANQDNLNGYYVVDINDFVYNPRISVSAPVGPINRNKISQGVMSPLYTVFTVTANVSLSYLELFFKTTFWHKYMNSIANFGARHDRMNVTSKDFFNMPVPIPSDAEQQKIVSFIEVLEQRLKLTDNELEKAKEWKKGLLQQMFV
ncbi:restriction endonuclease subunit S [Vibrio harveyi]|uniref:Restriction endonuclease subunit S n=1 Tax=Vibrio harveyi TaxID=669 RepID=A0ABM5XZ23_VIBHA|nr:restriction endonuclease subunit S [Vibrio harveyi]AMF98740.1 restriction endonuclease subunit S [Vibrio harveyi]